MDTDDIKKVKKRLNFRYDSPAEILERNSPVDDNAPSRASGSQTRLEDIPESSTAIRSRARRNTLSMPPPPIPTRTIEGGAPEAQSHSADATASRTEEKASQNSGVISTSTSIMAPPPAVASASVATERASRPPESGIPVDATESRRGGPMPQNPVATPRARRRGSMGPPPLPTRRNATTQRTLLPSERGVPPEVVASRREEVSRRYLVAVSAPVRGGTGTMGPPPAAASTSVTVSTTESAHPLEVRSDPPYATVSRSEQPMALAMPRHRGSMGPPSVSVRINATTARARPDPSALHGPPDVAQARRDTREHPNVQNPIAISEGRGTGTMGSPPTAASTSATMPRQHYLQAAHEVPMSYRGEPIPITSSRSAATMRPPPAPMSANAPPDRVHCPPDCSCRTQYHCPADCICRINDANIPAPAQAQFNKRRRSSSPEGDSSAVPAPDSSPPPILFAPVARHAIPDLASLIDPTQTTMQAMDSAAGSSSGWTWRAPPAGLYVGFHKPDNPIPDVEVRIEPVEGELPPPPKRRRLDEDEAQGESGPSNNQPRPGSSHVHVDGASCGRGRRCRLCAETSDAQNAMEIEEGEVSETPPMGWIHNDQVMGCWI